MPGIEVRHYTTEAGRDPISEFLDDLPVRARSKCSALIGWLATGEIDQHPKGRDHVDGDIWELRVQHDGEQYRFLYAVDQGTAYLLVPVHKKTTKADPRDIKLAKTRLNEIRRRRGTR